MQKAITMSVQSIFNKLHQSNPKIGRLLSLTTASGAITAQSFIASIPLWFSGALKTFTGNKMADETVIKIADNWIKINNKLIDNILPEKNWQFSLPDDLDPQKSYLLICNHQSWVDTSIIQYISENKLPLTRFFTKFELIYIPIVGQAFYFLDFPMMKRYSKEKISKNPALQGKDIDEAKRACELLKNKPFILLNYVEGTRFNQKKHQDQNSPYQHLLKPRAGGLSLAISALGDEIEGILDMTVVYPDFTTHPPAYSDLWKGNIKNLGVDIRHLDMPEQLFNDIKQGGYQTDETIKAQMFDWLDTVWQKKDARIDDMLATFNEC